jgi:hypothetical protein
MFRVFHCVLANNIIPIYHMVADAIDRTTAGGQGSARDAIAFCLNSSSMPSLAHLRGPTALLEVTLWDGCLILAAEDANLAL